MSGRFQDDAERRSRRRRIRAVRAAACSSVMRARFEIAARRRRRARASRALSNDGRCDRDRVRQVALGRSSHRSTATATRAASSESVGRLGRLRERPLRLRTCPRKRAVPASSSDPQFDRPARGDSADVRAASSRQLRACTCVLTVGGQRARAASGARSASGPPAADSSTASRGRPAASSVVRAAGSLPLQPVLAEHFAERALGAGPVCPRSSSMVPTT